MREAAAIITANGATLAGDRPLPPTPTRTRTRARARVVDHCGIRQYMKVSDEGVSGGLCNELRLCFQASFWRWTEWKRAKATARPCRRHGGSTLRVP